MKLLDAPGWASNHIEPLEAKHSWRKPVEREVVRQGQLFAQGGEADYHLADGTEKPVGEDYQFARESAVPNIGMDFQGSARHKINAWRSLADAEREGTAEQLLTRDQLLKNEPHRLLENLTPTTALSSLAAHLALNAFPAVPYDEETLRSYQKPRSFARQSSSPEQLRAQYYGAYQRVKAEAEKAAVEETSPVKVSERIHALTQSLIKEYRGQRSNDSIGIATAQDPYNPVANSLVDLSKRTATGYRPGKTSVMGRMVDFSGRLEKAYGKDVSAETLDKAAMHARAIIEGQSFNKAFGTVETGKKGFDAASLYVKTATRTGGRSVDASTVDKGSAFILGSLKMPGLQWGNTLTDAERVEHLQRSSEAFADLADVLKLPDEAISLGGHLGLAVGVRGRGGRDAGPAVINPTRKGGVGSLAHEWGHAFDNFIGAGGKQTGAYETSYESQKAARKEYEYVPDENGAWTLGGKRVRKQLKPSADTDPIRVGMKGVMDAMAASGFDKRMTGAVTEAARAGELSFKDPEYWTSPHEKFARTFERHVQRKLAQAGRENTYLAGVESHPFWPTDEEMETISPAMDQLIGGVREKHFPGPLAADIRPQQVSIEPAAKLEPAKVPEPAPRSAAIPDDATLDNMGKAELMNLALAHGVPIRLGASATGLRHDLSKTRQPKPPEGWLFAHGGSVDAGVVEPQPFRSVLGESIAKMPATMPNDMMPDPKWVAQIPDPSWVRDPARPEEKAPKIPNPVPRGQVSWVESFLEKQGVKREEMEAVGIHEALAGKEKVSRGELQQHFEERQVKVGEIWKGGKSIVKPVTWKQGHDPAFDEFEPTPEFHPLVADRGGYSLHYNPGQEIWEVKQKSRNEREPQLVREFNDQDSARHFVEARIARDEGGEDDTRWSRYQTPGGTNYRELLLTLPSREGSLPFHEWIAKQGYSDEVLGKIHNERGTEHYQAIKAWNDSQKKAETEKSENYQSSHWPGVPNVLAHVRMQDRVGSQGEKILHVEEIQSDLHQDGRKKGYKGELPASWRTLSVAQAITDYPDAGAWRNKDANSAKGFAVVDKATGLTVVHRWGPEVPSEEDAIALAKEQHDAVAVPQLPFRDSWHALAMHRVMHEAAKGGYDKVTWNTGEQIQSLVGGKEEGQQEFYDMKMVNWAKKFGKKYGADVEKAPQTEPHIIDALSRSSSRVAIFDANKRYMDSFDNKEDAEKGLEFEGGAFLHDLGAPGEIYKQHHSLQITPQMRETATKGFALFAEGGEAGWPEDDGLDFDMDEADRYQARREMGLSSSFGPPDPPSKDVMLDFMGEDPEGERPSELSSLTTKRYEAGGDADAPTLKEPDQPSRLPYGIIVPRVPETGNPGLNAHLEQLAVEAEARRQAEPSRPADDETYPYGVSQEQIAAYHASMRKRLGMAGGGLCGTSYVHSFSIGGNADEDDASTPREESTPMEPGAIDFGGSLLDKAGLIGQTKLRSELRKKAEQLIAETKGRWMSRRSRPEQPKVSTALLRSPVTSATWTR